jgi:hypothetical protein
MKDQDLRDFIARVRPDKWLVLQSGLHVPRAAVVQRQQVGAPGMAVYVTLRELRGTPATLPEIATTLRKIGVYEALQALSHIGLLLENHEWSNKDLQHALVRDLLPKEYSNGAARILSTEPNRVVFFEQQILGLMQLAVLYCPEIGLTRLEGNRVLFNEFVVNCVLGITDILESTYLSSARQQSTAGAGDISEALTSALLRNTFFNYRDQFPYMLARFWDMYLELPRQLTASPNHVDVEDAFAQATGVSLPVYLAVGFGIASQFMQASGKVGEHDVRKFVMDPTVYFSTTSLDDTTLGRCVEHLSSDLPSYRQSLLAELRRTKELYFSYTTMRQSPLLRFPNGACIPLSLRFLHERITVGVYWLIHDRLPAKGRSRFQTFFGELFQKYVEQTFARAFPPSPHLAKRVHFAKKYGSRTHKKETSDVIVLYGDCALFVEAKAARLRMEDSGIRGDVEAFREDLETKVVGAASQIDRVVRDFAAAKFRLDGFEASGIHRAYPVVLTFGYIPQYPSTWHEIQRMLDDKGLLQGPPFAPLQLINVEELEMLAGYLLSGGEQSLLKILNARENDPYYRFLPIKTYLAYMVPPPPRQNRWIARHLEQLADITIKALGLKDDQAALPERF